MDIGISSEISKRKSLKYFDLGPTEHWSELSKKSIILEDSELDLLKLMSTWPDIFVVNIDLPGHFQKIRYIPASVSVNIEKSIDRDKNEILVENNVKLISVKCYVEDCYATLESPKKTVN